MFRCGRKSPVLNVADEHGKAGSEKAVETLSLLCRLKDRGSHDLSNASPFNEGQGRLPDGPAQL
jgi:hypothetical protein